MFTEIVNQMMQINWNQVFFNSVFQANLQLWKTAWIPNFKYL